MDEQAKQTEIRRLTKIIREGASDEALRTTSAEVVKASARTGVANKQCLSFAPAIEICLPTSSPFRTQPAGFELTDAHFKVRLDAASTEKSRAQIAHQRSVNASIWSGLPSVKCGIVY